MQSFYYFWIRFTAVLYLIDTVAIANSLSSANEDIQYNCGNVVFSSQAVNDAMYEGLEKFDQFKTYPCAYKGPLYDIKREYEMFPIKENGDKFDVFKETQDYGYFVIFTLLGVVVDVIGRRPLESIPLESTQNFHDTICLRKAVPSRQPPSASAISSQHNNYKSTHTPDSHVGYQCGQIFFSQEIISNALRDMIQQKNHPNQDFSISHSGHPCLILNCYLWPLSDVKDKAISGGGGLSYHIITDLEFRLKGVASRSLFDVFERCTVVAHSQLPSIKTGQLNPVESGYQCGLDFFPDSYVASEVKRLKKFKYSDKNPAYPKKLILHPSTTDYILWPVFPNKKSFRKGRAAKWFIVMTLPSEKYCVAQLLGYTYNCCTWIEGVAIDEEETGEFVCLGKYFHLKTDLNLAKQEACKSKDKPRALKYPTKYIGPKFDIPGPYTSWPLVKGGFNKHPGRFRIVINGKCKIAGVLILVEKIYLKCQRESDRSTPGGDLNEPIYEVSFSNKKRHRGHPYAKDGSY